MTGHGAQFAASRRKPSRPCRSIVVMDRGYEDHDWWRKLTSDGVFFVSRLKDNTSCIIVAGSVRSPPTPSCGMKGSCRPAEQEAEQGRLHATLQAPRKIPLPVT